MGKIGVCGNPRLPGGFFFEIFLPTQFLASPYLEYLFIISSITLFFCSCGR
jgi:hypothetical protein